MRVREVATHMSMTASERAILSAEATVENVLIADLLRSDRDAGRWGEVMVPRALVARVCETLDEFELSPEDQLDSDALCALLDRGQAAYGEETP